MPLDEMELGRILSWNTAVFGPGPGMLGPSAIFRCSGPKTPIVVFDESSADLEIGTCRVDGSAVCVNTPTLEAEACREIRRMPAYGDALFGFGGTGSEARGGDGEPSASSQPALALARVPQDVYGLMAASGEIDVGGMAITLPSSHDFGFVYAFGFPLKFVYQGDADGEPLVLYLERLGWPDHHAQPVSALAMPLERQPQVDYLMDWEQGYARRDLREWGYGEGVELSAYRSAMLDVDGSPCVRVHETLTTTGPPETGPTSVADHQSLQMCSCLKTGALVNVTALFPISAMSGAQAENHAEAILSTLRLAPGTLDTRLEETTFASFQELQGGDPDLSWEMLDCVQGWNRTAQINGCNHAILRYPRVIAAGEWLLASDRLSDPEREEIQRAVHSSRTTLAVVHWVRAKLMHEEAPAQAREDCGAAERIVRDLDDADLIEELADCP